MEYDVLTASIISSSPFSFGPSPFSSTCGSSLLWAMPACCLVLDSSLSPLVLMNPALELFIFQISQLTVSHSPASGLYYLSELVEEHTVFTKKLLTRIIYGIIAVQILLALVDRFPPFLSLLSIGSHAVYAGNLRYFPTVRLTDPILMMSCGNII